MNGKVFAIADLSMQPVCNLPDTPSRVRLFTMVVQLLVMSNWLQLDITTNRIAITNATIENSIPEGAMQRRVSILAESRGTNHVMGSLLGTRRSHVYCYNIIPTSRSTGPTRVCVKCLTCPCVCGISRVRVKFGTGSRIACLSGHSRPHAS